MVLFETSLVAGVVLGGIFALAALGIVVVYRVTGVLNFANGAMGMFATFVAWWTLHVLHPLVSTSAEAFKSPASIAVAIGLALVFAIALGLILENLIFRWLRGRSQLIKAVITVGILLVLQNLAALLFGTSSYHEPIRFFDPGRCSHGTDCFSIHLTDQVVMGYSDLLVIVVSLVLAGALAAFLRFSRLGRAMRAASEDPVAASLWGVPVNIVGSVSWVLGSVVAAIAGILLISIGVNFDTVSLTVLVVDALAAALIGGLVSLPLTVLGGFILGILETLPRLWVPSTGLPKVIAVGVILAVLLIRSERSLLRRSA